MPSPTTALEIIGDALSLTNSVGVDQTLTADEVSDSLRAFNDLLEIFSTQNLAVYGSANESFNTAVGTSTYTIGSGGTWNTTRPVRINAPAYSTYNGVSYPLLPMSQEQYNLISNKTQTQAYPDFFLYINDFPLGQVLVWPVPSAVTPLTFSTDRVLTAISSAGAALSFPPGYAMAFKYKLAVMLAPLFGKKMRDYPDVVSIANSTFGDICRANIQQKYLTYDPALSSSRGRSTLAQFIGGY